MTLANEAFDLSNRVAIVTGAARGIGLATSTLLSQAGAHVVMTDVLHDEVTTAAADLDQAVGRRLDVSDKNAVQTLVNDVCKAHGKLDIYVNNAGVASDTPILEITEAELDRVHGINFRGVLFGCQAAAAAMIPAGSGSIINISSGAIDTGAPGVGAYATAKAAVHQLTRSFANEVGHGIRVNSVVPGWIDTPINERHHTKPDGSVDGEAKAAYMAAFANRSPLGLTGEPYDVAFVALYLASDAAKFMTGQAIRPNGGISMVW